MKTINKNIILNLLLLILLLSSSAFSQVTISSGTTVVLGSGTTELKDIGITNNGTFTQTSGTIIFSGSANSTIGGSNASILNNITINKSANTVGIILDAAISINGTLSMTIGDLNIKNKTVTLGSSAIISGESNDNLIFSDFTNGSRGTVTTTRTFASALSSQTFGNIGVVLTTDVAPGSTVVTRKFDAATFGSSTGMSKQFIILPTTNAGLNATYVVNYFANEVVGLIPANMVLYLSTNGGTNWSNTSATNSYNSGTSTGTLTLTGLPSFSSNNVWTASDNNNPLPVKLASFTSNVTGRDVKLTWVTEMENNNAGFEILRSAQNGNGGQNSEWTKVGYVNGSGTKNEPVSYSFSQIKINSGKYKYRLKQIDNNGNFEYFDLNGTVEVALPTKYNVSQNYPNPFNPTTKIDFELPENSAVNIVIFDMLGREVKVIANDNFDAGYHTIQINAANLASGTYIYRMVTKGFTKTLKMSIIK